MKFSLKVQDSHHHHHHHHQPPQNHHQPPQNHHQPLLLRAKIPITIFNLPFLSGFSTTTHHPSDLSLALSTNFPSGPTLKLSYSTISSTTTSAAPPPPFTLSLKSGIGLFGSPKDSPLIISANFSFSPNNLNSNPTFSLLLKPQLGSFSLRKSIFSNPNNGKPSNGETADNSFGFIPLEKPLNLKDFSLDTNGKDSIFKGVSAMARTEMPVAKRVFMNFRWGVNFPEDLSKQMLYLTVNKVGIERVVNEVKEVDKVKDNKKGDGNKGDVEVLKGMCLWMKRELDMLQRENKEMKYRLEEMNLGIDGRVGNGNGGKKGIPVAERSNGFEQWRRKKNSGGGEENVNIEVKKIDGNRASDVENELQRAIKAASSS